MCRHVPRCHPLLSIYGYGCIWTGVPGRWRRRDGTHCRRDPWESVEGGGTGRGTTPEGGGTERCADAGAYGSEDILGRGEGRSGRENPHPDHTPPPPCSDGSTCPTCPRPKIYHQYPTRNLYILHTASWILDRNGPRTAPHIPASVTVWCSSRPVWNRASIRLDTAHIHGPRNPWTWPTVA